MKRNIQSRISFSPGDPVYGDLEKLGDNPKAIRARIKLCTQLGLQLLSVLERDITPSVAVMALQAATSIAALTGQAVGVPTAPSTTGMRLGEANGSDIQEKVDLSFLDQN